MVWPGEHRMVYVLASRGMAWYMLLSGWVWHGMVCRAWLSISYGLARYGTVYGMALYAWIVWPGEV